MKARFCEDQLPHESQRLIDLPDGAAPDGAEMAKKEADHA